MPTKQSTDHPVDNRLGQSIGQATDQFGKGSTDRVKDGSSDRLSDRAKDRAAETFWRYFHEIFAALPRQGPGERKSTELAVRMLPELRADQRILDIGCGTGAQTIDLARATPAQIVAVDKHEPFIFRLRKRAAAHDLDARIDTQVADMHDLPFGDGLFDVIWSEGAIFIIGFARGLAQWRRLLKPGGYLVVSEFCWFVSDPPPELIALHTDGCSDIGNVDDRRKAVFSHRYRLVDEFVLPDNGWWENFYVPLGEQLTHFRIQHAGNAAALSVAADLQKEIDLYQKHIGAFGYVFFLLQRDDAEPSHITSSEKTRSISKPGA
jgi:SAM-dependent methyltransferase